MIKLIDLFQSQEWFRQKFIVLLWGDLFFILVFRVKNYLLDIIWVVKGDYFFWFDY